MYNLDVIQGISKIHGSYFVIRLMDSVKNCQWSSYVLPYELAKDLERIVTDTNCLWRLPSFGGRNFSEFMKLAPAAPVEA